jgi:ribonuclease-3
VCVATYLRRKYPDKKQGFLTDARKELVNNERIGALCQKVGLDTFYVISRHNEESVAINGRRNIQKLGDIFEAFIGALWTDCGNRFNIVYVFVTNVLEAYLDIQDVVTTITNYKDIFQKYCQREFATTPTYTMLESSDALIRVTITLKGKIMKETGEGTTRKKAEQMAAKQALEGFGVTFSSA